MHHDNVYKRSLCVKDGGQIPKTRFYRGPAPRGANQVEFFRVFLLPRHGGQVLAN